LHYYNIDFAPAKLVLNLSGNEVSSLAFKKFIIKKISFRLKISIAKPAGCK